VGRTAGSELVVLQGTLFETGMEVFFGSARAQEVIVHSEFVAHVRTPMHKPGMVDLQLRLPDNTELLVEEAFLFRDELTVHAIEPNQGPVTGGTPFTVQGEGFSHNTNVLFNGRLAVGIQVIDSQTIHAISPPGVIGMADVLVGTPWTSDVLKDGFQYRLPLQVDSIHPNNGPSNGISTVTLQGAGLTADANVSIGGVSATVLSASGDHELTVTVPGGPVGVADIAIQTPLDGLLLEDAFVFLAPPNPSDPLTLHHVTPGNGPEAGGTMVTLVVTGLESTDATIRFGGTVAPIESVNLDTNEIVVTAPPGVGTVPIQIDSAEDSDALAGAFSYISAPVIASVSPTLGSMDGGEVVSIYGSNLTTTPEVMIGALPAQVLSADDGLIRVRTPPGSPGSADVRVNTDVGETVLENGYLYVPNGGPELYAVVPDYGAIAGNTLVHLYGAGFMTAGDVAFDDIAGIQVQRLSTTELTVRSPRAAGPGVVDVSIIQDGSSRKIGDAFSYYNPESPYGGAWGPPIDGTVNVTVLDVYDTQPIAQAFVMLGNDHSPTYKGWTDDRGQITFSAPDIVGPQMVTAAKEQYTTYSVVEYDAENVTVHLIPFSPPSPPGGGGGGPTIVPYGEITGNVLGLGKYVVVPPQSCGFAASKGWLGAESAVNCSACETDADCSGDGAVCVQIANEGPFCATACTTSADCPDHFICGSSTSGGDLAPHCIPDPGQKTAYCQTTSDRLWEAPPTPHTPKLPEDDGSRAWTDSSGAYFMKSRLGELAVICVGGVIRDPADPFHSFEPLTMGVRRHLHPIPNDALLDIDVMLDIPLTKHVPIRLDGAPTEFVDPVSFAVTATDVSVRTTLDFGGEGYWEVGPLVGQGIKDVLLAHQPVDLSGQLDGVTYSFLAEVRGGESAVSGTQSYKVKVLHVDRLFQRVNGVWKAVSSGIPDNIHGLWGAASDDMWAVGANGLLAHSNGSHWFQQYAPTTADLNGLWGTANDHIVGVGDGGTIIRFNGATWSLEDTPTTANLHAVWGTAPDNMYAVGDGVVLQRDHLGWHSISSPPTNLRGIWGPNAFEFWTVGDDGVVWQYNGVWSSFMPGTNGAALNSIHGVDDQNVWIAGQSGTVLRRTLTGAWEPQDVPTTETLNAIVGTVNGTATAVGDRGTLLVYDGLGWDVQKAPKYGGDLLAVWGGDTAESEAVAAGTQVVTLGPMLSFPMIGKPVISGFGGSSQFAYQVDWTTAPSTRPTLNFLEMLAGMEFPMWWTVVEADVESVTFPNLPLIQGLYPLPPGTSIMLVVNRILKPGSTADNFDFWDTYDQGSWQSWARNTRLFVP